MKTCSSRFSRRVPRLSKVTARRYSVQMTLFPLLRRIASQSAAGIGRIPGSVGRGNLESAVRGEAESQGRAPWRERAGSCFAASEEKLMKKMDGLSLSPGG